MSKILITGAAGFIGSQLAYHLWKKGEELTLIDNFSYGSEDNLIFEAHCFTDEIIRDDILNTALINQLFQEKKFDYVYHIAGITPLPDCQLNPAKAVEVNTMGTVGLLEAARTYGIKKFIFASTSAVYENNQDFPSVEGNVVPPSLIYPNTKYTAERFCQSYADVYGMNITCMRFANVYGPHLDCLRTQPPVVGYLIRELFYNRQPVLHSTGTQRRDFVYVEDLIDLAERVQSGTGFDVVNVSTNTTISINELAKTVRRLMGKEEIEFKYVESSNYWNRYPALYEGAYPIFAEALDHEVNKYTQLSNAYAKEKYGWEPRTSLEEGVQATIDFSVKVLEKAASGQ
ncbi:MAG: NAD-dependent epimerase/dehydratase family protein [Lachnospiraceae bacterium]|nr:NAD-dependent epimerase/dehydratase family protein [Lachnospiraceae bacterium]